MAPPDHVPDSTDWLSTPLSCFAALEAALRCQVCKDFFKTPMITSCSHTFCSLCIRRALANDGKCPLCRRVEQEIKLRCNYSTEETVQAFAKARETALDLARNTAATSRLQKRAAAGALDANAAPGAKRLRTSARLQSRGAGALVLRPPEAAPAAGDAEQDDDDDEGEMATVPASEGEAMSDEDGDYVEEPKDGLLPCPSCQKRMKDWQVWSHLESCPGLSAASTTKSPSASTSRAPEEADFRQAQRRQQTTLERLPPLNYAMLKDGALRKKVGELGISSAGPRALVERRHKEYTTLWNANCDAARPKTKAQLLLDLDVWERTLGGRAPTTGRAAHNAALIRDKDFDGSAWAAKHSASFQDLIASARRGRLEARQGRAGAGGEDAAGEGSTEAAASTPVGVDSVEVTEAPAASPGQGGRFADGLAAHPWPFEHEQAQGSQEEAHLMA